MQNRSNAARNSFSKEIDDDLESDQRSLPGSDEEAEYDENSSEFSNDSITLWKSNRRCLVPLVFFSPAALKNKDHKLRQVGKKFGMSFRMVNECKIVRQIFQSHGFRESFTGDLDFNLMWTGKHLKTEVIRSFYKHQRINHFPRTFELTRKDRLYKNVQKMQETKGYRNFDIVPTTFVIPQEFSSFSNCYCREGGLWIVKPVASSRGRGIFVISHPEQVPTDESFVVSRYISNPLLIDGYKFDIRLYIVVTSFDPLVIYMHEEGLTRFATAKFEKGARHIGNHFMHLTNYSVNKRSLSYVQNSSAEVEDEGSKWTLGALLRRLRSQGRDVVSLMMRIEDAIVKTVLSAEAPISSACRMYVPYRENCFEIFGFDIIIDENMKPWVLEVNLSPSLACESPLDYKVKSHMLCDMFNLVGIPCGDDVAALNHQGANKSKQAKPPQRPQSGIRMLRSTRVRPSSAALSTSSNGGGSSSSSPLTADERQAIRRLRDEERRSGGFIRLFPSGDSMELYGAFLDSHAAFNAIVHEQLFGKSMPPPGANLLSNFSMLVLRQNQPSQPSAIASAIASLQRAASLNGSGSAAPAYLRSRRYERSLPRNNQRIRSPSKRSKSQSAHVSRSNKTDGSAAAATSKPPLGAVDGDKVNDGEQRQNQQNGKTEAVSPSSSSEASTASNVASKAPPVALIRSQSELTSSSMIRQQQQQQQQQQLQQQQQQQAVVLAQNIATVNSLMAEIDAGRSLSVAQARSAFTRYLELVRSRLLTPLARPGGSNSSNSSETEMQNLELVVRFMRRAVTNLSEPVRVVPPSKRLSVDDQRILVANQMTEFLRVYKSDTNSLLGSGEAGGGAVDSGNVIDGVRLARVISVLAEAELERFLTHYTKVKRSASIFLGSSFKNRNSRPPSSMQSNASQQHRLVEQSSKTVEQTASTASSTINGGGSVTTSSAVSPVQSPRTAPVPELAMAFPEGVVVHSEPGSSRSKPPATPSTSVTRRPVSASNNNSSRSAFTSSLASAVAAYGGAPVRSQSHHHQHQPKSPPSPSPSRKEANKQQQQQQQQPSLALATSAYLRWSSSNGNKSSSLSASSSDAILNAALQRIALKYSNLGSTAGGSSAISSSHRTAAADTSLPQQQQQANNRQSAIGARLGHANSMTSLVGNNPVQFSVEVNSRSEAVAPIASTIVAGNSLSNNNLRPQSASSASRVSQQQQQQQQQTLQQQQHHHHSHHTHHHNHSHHQQARKTRATLMS